MSADLFAEFNNSSSSTPPPSAPAAHQFGELPKPQTQPLSWSQDALNFSASSSNAVSHFQPAPHVPSHEGAATSMSGWGQPPRHSSQLPTAAHQDLGEDDGWGDFETAEPSAAAEASTAPKFQAGGAASSVDGWGSNATLGSNALAHDKDLVQHSATNILGGNLVDWDIKGALPDPKPQPTWSSPKTTKLVEKKAPGNSSSVLFDAEDFELQGGEEDDGDFDEFGDFESVQLSARAQPAPTAATGLAASIDLLGLDDAPESSFQTDAKKDQPKPAAAATTALSFGSIASNQSEAQAWPAASTSSMTDQSRAAGSDKSKSCPVPSHQKPKSSVVSKSLLKKTSPKPAPPKKVDADDDEWAAWDDFSGHSNNVKSSQTTTQVTAGAEDWGCDADEDKKGLAAKIDDSGPPPINVPPPSVLLSAFPELFNSGNALFKPIANQTASIKQQVLSNPRTLQFLEGYILLATTAARVIAGRKHRWHRDKMLAKSMSISTAGSKGMKLAGVDKTQSKREDREAGDVIDAWREHVGRLRSAVAAANSTCNATLRVPELAENMQVQTAKMVPTAPKACIICGLKREERVGKVDFDVEDSFGEWWVDHWGHRACKNFWLQHEQRLRQR